MATALERILECPVCHEQPSSIPIYRCDNGHIYCNECQKKITVCHECMAPLNDKRCLMSEKIFTEILSQVIKL